MQQPTLTPAWLTESWDSHDPWGSTLHIEGQICDALTVAGQGDQIPDSCGYSPAMGLNRESLRFDEYETAGEILAGIESGQISVTDLAANLLTLNRFADALRWQGRDY